MRQIRDNFETYCTATVRLYCYDVIALIRTTRFRSHVFFFRPCHRHHRKERPSLPPKRYRNYCQPTSWSHTTPANRPRFRPRFRRVGGYYSPVLCIAAGRRRPRRPSRRLPSCRASSTCPCTARAGCRSTPRSSAACCRTGLFTGVSHTRVSWARVCGVHVQAIGVLPGPWLGSGGLDGRLGLAVQAARAHRAHNRQVKFT